MIAATCHPDRPNHSRGHCAACYHRNRYHQRRGTTPTGPRDADGRLEDLQWMAETGENAAGAARRLGIAEITLEKWCRSHDAADVWLTLHRRNPIPLREATAA